MQRFAEEGARVLGTVLNSRDPRSSEGTDYTHSYQEFAQQYPHLVGAELMSVDHLSWDKNRNPRPKLRTLVARKSDVPFWGSCVHPNSGRQYWL